MNEGNGFLSKYQSGFRKSKSTNDHLFHLSQTIMESFNLGEHVIETFLDVCQVENKTKSRENKSHNILQVQICNKGRTCFIFVRRPPFVLSSHKIPRCHFDNRMTFTKHFEEILECCSQIKISSFKNIGQQKVGSMQVPQPFYKSINNV